MSSIPVQIDGDNEWHTTIRKHGCQFVPQTFNPQVVGSIPTGPTKLALHLERLPLDEHES